MNFKAPTVLALHEQHDRLIAAYPGALCRIDDTGLFWQGHVKPSDESRTYIAQIRYAAGALPFAHIIQPYLHFLVAQSRLPNRRLPHVYRLEGDPLCLFLGGREWNPSLAIADTTVPWISLWLQFFELWLFTNTWEGSGAPYQP